ncbi:60S ribosomal protein L1 [Cucumispora dikerogammari]|nr:60S ribosomal protein L1 [Cucumispora dikerogammari]
MKTKTATESITAINPASSNKSLSATKPPPATKPIPTTKSVPSISQISPSLNKQSIMPILESIKADCINRKKKETISLQITIKGYDFNKDERFNKSVVLPHLKRFREKIVVLGDNLALEEECRKLNLPFVSFNEITGNNKEKIKEKKKLTLKYDIFIIFGRFAKHFNIKFVMQKRKNFFLLANINELSEVVEKSKKTVNFKLKKNPDIAFPIGTTEMEVNDVWDNYEAGMEGLVSVLKKGVKNLQGVKVKSDQGKVFSLL